MTPRLSLALALLLVCCTAATASSSVKHPHITFSDTDGLTKATAVVIIGAKSEEEGVAAEYEWLDTNLPGAAVVSQGIAGGDSIYDRMLIRLASGKERELYFDIVDFFGK